ncbi:MAG TPA: Crp/Fnr family transcriptional regulator [Bradyrhizobium sp.]|nr:Crp/Fnr family transcriptional regulator [Bradyrhizobium sp.]
MEHSIRTGNRLLAGLPLGDFQLLAPHLRKVALEPEAVLTRSGDLIEHINFPLSGMIAFIMEMPNGQTVSTAVIGNDGATGLIAALGDFRSPTTAVVRVAGTALQIAPARFQAALSRSGALRYSVQTFTQALLAQFQNVAACNALHSVEARTARWLLQIRDRSEGDFLPLTQEALSELLGVRRTTVTHIVQKLRSTGAIRSNRRRMIEVDRPLLEASACECYEAMRRGIDRIMTPDATKPRIQAATANQQFRRANGERPRSH